MIYLIRHGQAAASWGSHPDPGLSELGETQAEAVAKRLAQDPIAHAVSSPMARCQETGSFFARQSGLTLTIEPHVTEIPTPEDIEDRISWLRGLMSGSWSDAPEIVAEWRQNLIRTVSDMPENTVVFTHFVAINAIVGHLEGTDQVTVFRPNYCSMTKLEKSGDTVKLIQRGDELDTRVL